jgi:hypothetical protein
MGGAQSVVGDDSHLDVAVAAGDELLNHTGCRPRRVPAERGPSAAWRAGGCRMAGMKLRPLIWGLLLAAAAFSLARALATHDGVGVIEYVVGVALVVVLAAAAFRAGRRAVRPPA